MYTCILNIEWTEVCLSVFHATLLTSSITSRASVRCVSTAHHREPGLGGRLCLKGVTSLFSVASELSSTSFISRSRTAQEMSPQSPRMKVQMKHRPKYPSHLKSLNEE
jgi:hypothetical protein